MEGLIFQSSEFGTDEIYANMEEYIMQITRDNYSQYAQMVQQMFGKKASSNDPLAQCDYGNFSLRFKPVDINFTKPNWDTIMTKRDKPAMSEEEFDEAIKELAAHITNYQGINRRLDNTVTTLAVLQNENKALIKILTQINE